MKSKLVYNICLLLNMSNLIKVKDLFTKNDPLQLCSFIAVPFLSNIQHLQDISLSFLRSHFYSFEKDFTSDLGTWERCFLPSIFFCVV